jgi:hypothetical protein
MSQPIRVMVQMRYSASMAAAAFTEAPLGPAVAAADLPGIEVDESFGAVRLPAKRRVHPASGPARVGELFTLGFEPEASTYVVRASVSDETKLLDLLAAAAKSDEVVGVFSDPRIAHFGVCPTGPMGTDLDVERLLGAKELHRLGMDGSGVRVAVVDTGINRKHLEGKGKTPDFAPEWSWSPRPDDAPGEMPVDHGTMCAFDACIAAPKCILADQAMLRTRAPGENIMEGILSDALLSFGKLLHLVSRQAGPVPLVVNNSWGMYRPDWDFPVGHPMNFSDNPGHPFNLMVGTLEAAGADLLFASGNCGPECPHPRCDGHVTEGIYGANSHDAVLSVAGVATGEEVVGYSTRGPGRLVDAKPDIACFTHFAGSGVYAADTGTSAAAPVAAGVIAAMRSKYPPMVLRPAVLRNLVRRTAREKGAPGFDYEYGYGIIDPPALLAGVIKTVSG